MPVSFLLNFSFVFFFLFTFISLRLLSLNDQVCLRPDKQRGVVYFAHEHRLNLLFLRETNFCFHDAHAFNSAFSVSSFF